MSFLTDTEKAALTKQIQHAEARTTGEIVTVIATQSDSYRYIPLLWAALLALSLPGWYYLYQYLANSGWTYPGESAPVLARLYQWQVLAFFGLGMLFQLPQIRMWMIPAAVKRLRAARSAREQFFLQNLHQTQDRTGILIFVSVTEHYVEIVVDTGIAAVVDNSVWDDTINDFIEHIRRREIASGFSNTIEHCKDILWQHFPADEVRPDVLPNHLIEV